MAIADAVRRAAAAARALPWQPWSGLALLVAVQWAATAAFALTVRHNGWLFYQGGDQTWYYTSSWALADVHVPLSPVGWGWPYLLTPVSLAAGPSFLNALPAIVLVQTLLLGPVLILSVYSIGARIGGRLAGYWAAACTIGLPFLAIRGFDPRYHDRWVEQFLPQALGLTGMSDYAAMVTVTAAAALLLRALQERDARCAVLAGLVGGLALGIKPSTAPVLAGAGLAVLVARRWREGLAAGLALVPALVVLALWKQRGLGSQPLFALGGTQLAAGLSTLVPPLGAVDVGHYVDFDWKHMNDQFISLREFFWSPRLLEVLPLAGVIAVVRRSRPTAALLAGWLGVYVLVKGTNQYSTVDSGSIWRMLLPALPAYTILASAVPLLVPRLGARGTAPLTSPRRAACALPRPRLLLGASALVLAGIPLLLVAAAPHIGSSAVRTDNGLYVPVEPRFRLQADAIGGGQVRLAWHPAAHDSSIGVFYRVLRSRTGAIDCATPQYPVTDCRLPSDAQVLDPTRSTEFVDTPPAGGSWSYAVQALANWRDDTSLGDMLLLSPAAAVTVR